MTESNPSFKIIIIGSGLAGSLLANGLIRNNIEVAVYERLERQAKREGYQIRLGAEALRGFRTCLEPQHIKGIVNKFGRSGGFRSVAPVIYGGQFQKLLDLSQVPDYTKSAPINRGILRDLLAEPVYEAGKLQYSRSFTRYEILDPFKSTERVRVWFSDGSTDECDILIGADGSHSRVNAQLGLENISPIESHMSMIAKHELPTSLFEKINPKLREKPAIAFSDNKSLWFNVYLPDKVDGLVGKTPSDFDDDQSSIMFGLHVPMETCPADLSKQSTKQKWEFVASALTGWSKEYQEMVEILKDSDLYVYQARSSTPPPLDWRTKVKSDELAERGHSRVWLLGDAIHPMLPNRGMGGNQAMADTATMLPLLVKLAKAVPRETTVMSQEIASSCKTYEDEMIPRAFDWVQKSGGLKMIPVDPSTVSGGLFFALASVALKLASIWFSFTGLFYTRKYVDEAPELKD